MHHNVAKCLHKGPKKQAILSYNVAKYLHKGSEKPIFLLKSEILMIQIHPMRKSGLRNTKKESFAFRQGIATILKKDYGNTIWSQCVSCSIFPLDRTLFFLKFLFLPG